MARTTRRWFLGTVALLLLTGPAFGRTPEPLQRITLRLYDHSGVPQPVLQRAEEELGRLFARMDLGVDVILCYRANQITEITCNLPPRASEFHVAIVDEVPRDISGRKISPETCGFALLTPDPMETKRTNIFYSCVRRTAEETQVALGVVLGHLMAHEMGHLLLGTKQHATEGLFRARIRPEDWRLAAQGRLEFSREEAGRLRAAVAVRLGGRDAYEVARGAAPIHTASPQ